MTERKWYGSREHFNTELDYETYKKRHRLSRKRKLIRRKINKINPYGTGTINFMKTKSNFFG